MINVFQLALEKAQKFFPNDMSHKALHETLFPSTSGKQKYKIPDLEHLYKELLRDGVKLGLF